METKLKNDPHFSLKLSDRGPDGGLKYWLCLNGKPVSFAKVYDHSRSSGTVIELCDIETREGYKNQGYATKLLQSIAEGHQVSAVVHSGGYTPDGFNFIASKLQREGEPAKGASYRAMSFVYDWDSFTPLHG